MPQGKVTPRYKFRLLCKRCNSYMHTHLDVDDAAAGLSRAMQIRLRCTHCGTEAESLEDVDD